LSRIKTLCGLAVRGISPVRKEKVYGGNDLPKNHVLNSDRHTDRQTDRQTDSHIRQSKF